MKKMIMELEEKLKQAKAQDKDWEAKEKFWKAAVESAQKERMVLKEDIENLEMMIEAAKGLHKSYGAEKTEKQKNQKSKEEEIEEIDPRHKRAMVLQINQYDTVTNRWKSQKNAAEELKCTPSYLSQLMKLDKDEQIKRKGYALVWQY